MKPKSRTGRRVNKNEYEADYERAREKATTDRSPSRRSSLFVLRPRQRADSVVDDRLRSEFDANGDANNKGDMSGLKPIAVDWVRNCLPE